MTSAKTYMVKDIFGPTFQGEGSLCGQPTLFLRLSGCNMWDGRPETRAEQGCPFCDTDFRGGERLGVDEIVKRLLDLAVPSRGNLWVTVSGGEPMLQIDTGLLTAIKGAGYGVAIETNGTRDGAWLPGWVHVTMSPKVPPDQIILGQCDDLKVLYPHPHPGITPEAFANFPARARFLQPVNGDDEIDAHHLAQAVAKAQDLTAQARPWGISLQTHKIMGVE